jgi:hypothetical protein
MLTRSATSTKVSALTGWVMIRAEKTSILDQLHMGIVTNLPTRVNKETSIHAGKRVYIFFIRNSVPA